MQPVPDEFAAFCAREHPRLVGALGLYCGDAHLAEDVAQEALARACRDWEKVRNMTAPGAWVHRVGINLANSHYRRRSVARRHRPLLAADLIPSQEDPTSVLAVRSAVAALPRRKRTAVVLRHYLGYSVAETARIMRVPEGTVKTLTHRAFAELRGVLGTTDLQEVPDA